jgi:methylmalonyl-CoA mutase
MGADLVVIETPGIGQGDAAIVPFVDVPMYVMTPEFGAASQLEKIDMLDFAETSWHQQVRAPRGGGRAARRAPPVRPQPRAVPRRPGHTARVRHGRLTLQRQRRHRPVPAPAADPRAARSRHARGFARARGHQGVDARGRDRSRRAASATWRRSPRRSASTTRTTEEQAALAQQHQQLLSTAELLQTKGFGNSDVAALAEEVGGRIDKSVESLLAA